MAELKPGWRRVKFGEVVRQVKEKTEPESSGLQRYVAGEHMDTDDLRIRRWGEIGDGYLGPAFHVRFRPGQVLYGSRRTYLRKVAVADFEGICANTTFVLESANPSMLLPELLPFIMQAAAFHEHSIRESKGSVNPYVNFSDLTWYEFALPPLDEQRRILKLFQASLLVADAAYDAVAAAWTMLRADLVDSLDPASYGENVELGTLIEIKHGYAFASEGFITETTSDPILLTPKNFSERGVLDFSSERTKRFRGGTAGDFWLKNGDLVVLMTDLTPSARLLGAPGIIPSTEPVLHNQRIGLVRIHAPDRVRNGYLYFCFRGERLRRQIRSTATGTTVRHTSPSSLCKCKIPLPPACAQERLVERWNALHNAHNSLSLRHKAAIQYRAKASAAALEGLV